MNLNLESVQDPTFAFEHPNWLARTSTVFARDTLSILTDRGLDTDFIKSIQFGLPEGVIVAGGYFASLILDEPSLSKDLDVFCTGKQAFVDVVNLLLNPPAKPTDEDGEPDDSWAWRGYKLEGGEKALENVNSARFLLFKCPNRPDLQVIRLAWYTDVEHVLDTFDLTVAMFGIDRTNFVYLPAAFFDVMRKRLIVRKLSFPVSTLRRIIKYTKKGFYACPGALGDLCEKIAVFDGNLSSNKVVSVD